MMKKLTGLFLAFLLSFSFISVNGVIEVNAAGINYYVSFSIGNDNNNGTSSSTPWKTLSKVSNSNFAAGDTIYLKCGDTWSEQLEIHNSGTSTNPIRVTSYDNGPNPRILRNHEVDSNCILINNAAGLDFSNLELGNSEQGVMVNYNTSYPNADYLHFTNIFFHDITVPNPDYYNYSSTEERWGCAFFSRYNGAEGGTVMVNDWQIKNCYASDCDGFFETIIPITNLVFDGITTTRIPFNTIDLPGGINGVTVKNSVFSHNGGTRPCPIGGTDIMAGGLDNCNTQDNEFGWRTRYPGNPDGCAVDFEWGDVNYTLNRNFFHDCDAAGLFIFSNPAGPRQIQNMLVDSNIFYHNSANYPDTTDWGEIAIPQGQPTGTISNNKYYLLSGIPFIAHAVPPGITVSNNTPGTLSFVSMPTVSNIGGVYSAQVSVNLSCTTSGATIRYTTDGSIPTSTSATFTGTPISITKATCLNVKAFKSGMENSTTNTQIYRIETNIPEVAKAWDFNTNGNMEGWAAQSQITDFAVNNGYLSGSITGADPFMISSDNLNLDISNYKSIKVKIKNSTGSGLAQIYFTTNSDGTWNDAKSKNFLINPNDGNYTEYIFDMSDVVGWTGSLKQLRIDPNALVSSGTFSIDFVYIVKGTSVATVKAWEFTTNGNTEGWMAANQVSSLNVNNGYFGGTINGIDPNIMSADSLNVDISNSKYIRIKFKNSTSSTISQIYFITNADGTWNEAKNMNYTSISNDSNYTEYLLDMSGVAGWTGILKQLRLDPNNGQSSGTFSLDFIRITNQ